MVRAERAKLAFRRLWYADRVAFSDLSALGSRDDLAAGRVTQKLSKHMVHPMARKVNQQVSPT